MPSSLLSLPAELQAKIFFFVAYPLTSDLPELREFSTTCRLFRTMLLPTIYKNIVLRNNSESAARVASIISKYAHHAERLYFVGSAPGDKHDDFSDTEKVFPDEVAKILSDLSKFPNLQSLSVRFELGLDENGEMSSNHWENDFYMFEDEESEEDVVTAETNEGWRAMMAKTFNALARNERLEELEIRNLVPKTVSAWSTDAFQNLLGTLDRFRISLWGADNGAGWRINTLESYGSFVDRMDWYFFGHLAKTTELSLRAHQFAPICTYIWGVADSIPFALKPDHMPLLRRVHLERIFIDTSVIKFLVDHTGTLESILFQHCYSGYFEDAGRMMDDAPVKWHELFTALIEAEPKRLHEFVILPTVIPYTENGNDPGQPPETFEQDSQKEFWAAVHAIRDDPQGRRIFPHGSIDDKYGMLFDGYKENMEAYMRGDDQRAYDRLMVVLEENKVYK